MLYKQVGDQSGIRWHWNPKKLEQFLSGREETYLMGNSSNLWCMSEISDEVYYLMASEEVIRTRMKQTAEAKTNFLDNGSTEEQRNEITSKMPIKLNLTIGKGFKIIDAFLSPEKLYSIIVLGYTSIPDMIILSEWGLSPLIWGQTGG